MTDDQVADIIAYWRAMANDIEKNAGKQSGVNGILLSAAGVSTLRACAGDLEAVSLRVPA